MQKECKHCHKILSLDNFYKKGENNHTSYCKSCESLRKKKQAVDFKKKCLQYKKEFCCSTCGYDKNICALDFHHVDPSEKEFTISARKSNSINDSLKKELDKCIVLCANCHRELHSLEEGYFKANDLRIREQYYCIDCDKECSHNSKRCYNCYNKNKINKSKCPARNVLLEDLKTLKYFTKIGNKYNVSDNCIRKWCTKLNIPYK